jgi:arylsulfate sulfotransferase
MSRLRGYHIWLSIASVTLLTFLGSSCGSGGGPTGSYVATTPNPLVAAYNLPVPSGAQTWVEFGPDTNYGRQTSQFSTASNMLSILVAGMKPSTLYHMRAHIQFSDGTTWVDQDHTFTTGPLPSSKSESGAPANGPVQEVPTFQVVTPAAAQPGVTPAPGVELLSLTVLPNAPAELQIVATDLQGNVIWFCPQAGSPIRLLPNGDYLTIVSSSNLTELDLACNVVRNVSLAQVNQSLQANGYDFTVPNSPSLLFGPFHHDVIALPNGHWIALCEIAKTFDNLTGYPGTTTVVGDTLVDIDPNGNVVWAWNSFDHLDVNRHPYFGLPDWTHSNAIVYTPDGNLLLSMRAQSWILKIDYANGNGSGDILWRLGEGGDLTLAGGDPSQWFYAQHYPNLLAQNGSLMTLAVYDDGDYRTYSDGAVCGSSSSAPACYSRATIFQVDESTNLATLQWQYLPGLYSFWGGSIGVLSNGDVEFDSSEPFDNSSSQIMEVTPGANPQTVWQMNITGENAYRGYRMPSLYPGVTWNQ